MIPAVFLPNKKTPQVAVFVCMCLTFGELGRFTRFLQAVFLSFLHSRVAGQETCLFKNGTEIGIGFLQCTCKTHANGTGLTGVATAVDLDEDVVLAFGFRND